MAPPKTAPAAWWQPSWKRLLTAAVTLLAMTPVSVAQAAKSAADYYVHSLPGAPEPLLKMFAGHIEIDAEHNGNLFFWLFKNRHITDRQRTVIWLNGGPGCSSMDGALMEAGPYRVNPDGTLRFIDGSWDEFANIVFIDQPVGTGFSYVDTNSYVHELDEMAQQMVTFLQKFFDIFPELAHDDLYVAGESYAGQWIPYVAKAILDHNDAKPGDGGWNLSGLLIGNGWISGPDQYLATVPFAYEAGLLTPGSDAEASALETQKQCILDLNADEDDKVDIGSCERIMQDIMRQSQNEQGCVNMYDVRLRDTYPSCGMNWPPDLVQMTPYLRRADVVRALHINQDKKTGWVECSDPVSRAFTARQSKTSRTLLPALLARIPVLLFSGDQDFICNHLGTENLINNLEWNGGRGMTLQPGVTAPKRDWTFDGAPAGQYQSARNLTYLRFYNASHMVPFDVPRRARDMLDRFLRIDVAAAVGSVPADSHVDGDADADGEDVGGIGLNPGFGLGNGTADEAAKIQAAKWLAYRRSGEVALVFVIILASGFAYFVWRDRRRRRHAGYTGVAGSDPFEGSRGRASIGGGLGLDAVRQGFKNRREERDVEAAKDFDESELDDLTEKGRQRRGGTANRGVEMEDETFGLDDEEAYVDDVNGDVGGRGRVNGHG